MSDKSFEYVIRDDPADRLEVEIGDTKDLAAFQPQVKIKRWDNEVNASFRLVERVGGLEQVGVVGNKVTWQKGGLGASFENLPASKEFVEGAHEFEVILAEKPASNVLVFSMQAKGLEFHYQPELTPEEIARGAVRPERVVGSYAVYHILKRDHAVGGKNYRSGKAFHIYRPRVYDANLDEIWGELHIDEVAETLTITIDQKWLDGAKYPVVIDPTFGYEVIGGTTGWNYNDYIMGSWAEATGGAGTGDKITVYLDTGSADVAHFNCHLYAYVADNDVGAAITNGKCTERVNVNNAGAWEDFVFPTGPAIADNTKYFLCGWSDDNDSATVFDTVSNAGIYVADVYDNNWPDPIAGETGCNNRFSIYCTYTAAAAGALPMAMDHYRRRRMN